MCQHVSYLFGKTQKREVKWSETWDLVWAKGLLTLSRFTIYWYNFVWYKNLLGGKAEMFPIFSWIHIHFAADKQTTVWNVFYVIIAVAILTLTKVINEYFIAVIGWNCGHTTVIGKGYQSWDFIPDSRQQTKLMFNIMKESKTVVHLLRKICTSLNFLWFVCFVLIPLLKIQTKSPKLATKKIIIKAFRRAAEVFQPFLAASATLKHI